jgi:hypothetical protein
MNEFIFEIPNSLPDALCDDIITMYELEDNKYHGVTFAGVNKHVKDTTDLIMPKNNKVWERIETILYKQLMNGLDEYMKHLNKDEYSNKNNKYNIFDNSDLHVDCFMLQKYNKCKGRYTYHNDFANEPEKNRYRVITFIWYLNDVTDGGETEFFGGKINIKPEKGKLVLFPASWAFPHRGKMPISNDKYIITNWFYKTGL